MRKEYLTSAIIAMKTNMLRTILSMLGIIIGVFSVVVLLAIGEGTQVSMVENFNKMGANSITISAGSSNRDIRAVQTQSSSDVLSDDFIEYLKGFGAVKTILPTASISKQAIYKENNTRVDIQGIIPEQQTEKQIELKDGRFLNENDNDSFAMVAVVGTTTTEELFAKEDPIGKEIVLQDKVFTIVGTIADTEDFFAPIKTVMYKLSGKHYYDSLSISLNEGEDVTDFKEYLETDLLTYFKVTNITEAPISVRSLSSLLESVEQITSMMKAFLASIAAISLLVGGIGVMNIMLVSVTERTKEIGIRKAIGAKQGDILGQFLIESIILSIVAGGIGLVLSFGAVSVIQNFTQAIITLNSIMIAFGSSVTIGIVFGILPARKAAKLRPIDALRTE